MPFQTSLISKLSVRHHGDRLREGEVCDICDANKEPKAHPPDYAVDGLETWWQSPPLSRGMKYNEVNLTIELGRSRETENRTGTLTASAVVDCAPRASREATLAKEVRGRGGAQSKDSFLDSP
ncbi:Laminin subunit alpha [Eumeta japonica]|uniref:Laminin subunit alpha n=1 Tax=Eumeta variegata TaxID=151549 RepID=A0A4C2AE35_EUMVA|nr:Laminin subunit alpha [Eumeta japonica]